MHLGQKLEKDFKAGGSTQVWVKYPFLYHKMERVCFKKKTLRLDITTR